MMKEKIKKCLELVESVDKISVIEMDNLLKDRNDANRDKFILGYLRYIFNMSLKLYQEDKDWYDDYYDFEEMFNDGIILAQEIYNNYSYIDFSEKFDCFKYFCRVFSLQFGDLIKGKFFLKIDRRTLDIIKVIVKLKQKFLKKYGFVPTNKQLCDKYNLNKYYVDRAYFEVGLEECKKKIMCEDAVVENLLNEKLREDLEAALSEIDDLKSEVLKGAYGFDSEKKTEIVLGEELDIKRGKVNFIKRTGLNEIKRKHPELKKYLTL